MFKVFINILIINIIACSAFGQDVRKKGRKEKKEDKIENKTNTPLVQQNFIELKGTVIDSSLQEPMIGVTVWVEGTSYGTYTDGQGFFTIQVPAGVKVRLKVSSVGYAPITVDYQTGMRIMMQEEMIQANEIVISASRVPERILESPVTIEKLDLTTLREMPTPNIYESIVQLKGAEQFGASLLFKVINTRGFNSTTNLRFVQRIDGMDMQAPGLNFPLSMLNGASDLDIDNAELIPGASSALYGPNAFNGLMNITTKNPWEHQGLSTSLKMGATHIDSKDTKISPYVDFSVRYAKVINPKIAFKTNISYVRGTEWFARDFNDFANYAGTINPTLTDKPGQDLLNVYGDEVSAIFDSASTSGLLTKPMRISRTGYKEEELFDYGSFNIKGDASVHVKFNSKLEWINQVRVSTGTTIYQAVNRYAIKDFKYLVGRSELKGENFFVRAYAGLEDAGNSYDARFAGINIQRKAKSDEDWFQQYLMAYSGFPTINYALAEAGMAPIVTGNDAAARAFADGNTMKILDKIREVNPTSPLLEPGAYAIVSKILAGNARFQPGTQEFQNAFNSVTQDPNFNTGSKFIDHSKMYMIDGQYDFKNQIKFIELIAGGNFRFFDMNSEGTIFSDTAGHPLAVWEVGMYAQATKRFFRDKVRISASARADKSTNFKVLMSPRIAAVYTLDKNKTHFLRASWQTGFRMPTLQSQYIDLSLGFTKYIGSVTSAFEPYGIVGNNYSQASVNDFLNSYYHLMSIGYHSDSAIKTSQGLLRTLPMENIKPEKLQTFEIGYKGLLKKKIYIDFNAYYNTYENFEGSIDFVGGKRNWNESTQSFITDTINPQRIADANYTKSYYRRYYNSSERVTSYGSALGLSYSWSSKYSSNISYTYCTAKFSESARKDNLVASFNSPQHKVVFGISARNIVKTFGFALNYRWQDTFEFKESFASGIVPAYHNIDAQISYKIPSIKTTLRLGATNLLNNRRREVLGAGTIGAMTYFQIIFDENLF